jgi:ABC-type polysaccharide/polyol phosphate export permease
MTAIISHFNMWFLLGWYDMRQKYRRSLIGPFWITISSGVMVACIGFVFSKLFGSQLAEYLPNYAAGQILWSLISLQIIDSCNCFIQYRAVMKQIDVPITVHILRKLWYNLILFFHNALIIVVALAIFKQNVFPEIFLALPAFLLVCTLLFFISIVLGIICTRFRDIAQIVDVMIHLVFFFTPIVWMKKTLPGDCSWVTDYNPFYHVIEVIRAPLLGHAPDPMLWIYVSGYVVVSGVIAVFFIRRFRDRVTYWL